MKKKLLAILLAAGMALNLAGCGGGAAGDSAGAAAGASGSDDVYDVGIITIAYTDEFCTLLAKNIEKQLNGMGGYSVTLTDGKNDPQTQIDLINTFITKDVDAIILQAADCAGVVPGVKACNDAGIPLICCEVIPTEGDFTYTGPSNFAAGEMQANLLMEMLPEGGNVVYLEGTNGMTHALQRKEGFVETISDKFTILDSQDADFVKDEGMRITEAWIQKYTEGNGVSFDAVICGNDQMALGAMEALKTAGIPDGEIIIMGIDGTAPCIQAVADGKMACSIYQSGDHVADITIDCIKKLQAGETLDKEYLIDWEMVNADNYKDYMQ
ncbi:sugar ABC transporter substrate-binding protein [Intestinibacillus massiliensis]|nr:sugar ABC transporter substrate-binding protein [Intestinibacillus massiliensis]